MIYTATAMWLMVVVLLAWGVHHVWSGISKPKTVNAVLLPGTLIAQLGRILGLLVTGATVRDTALMKGDEEGAPAVDPNPEPKIPVVGPVFVALLPILALGAMIYLVVVKLVAPVVDILPKDLISKELPATPGAFWEQLRGLVSLAEGTLNAVRGADAVHWRIAIFIYLMVCLTVRMAPHPSNVRGHLGATVVLGFFAWLAGTVSQGVPELIQQAWPLLSLTVGWLLLLMLITLFARGALSSVRLILSLDQ